MDRISKIRPNLAKRVRMGLHKCGDCKSQFTVKVGTVFEHLRIPLHKALQAVYLLTCSKKGWRELVWRTRAPFQFEAIAVVEASFLVWLVSPMNIALGLALGLLTGWQIALVRIARRCAAACGLKPAAGVLAALPGLLAGSACCAPILFVLLGVQVTASLITLMGLMIPAAFAFLLVGLALTLRFAARRCAEAAA